MEKLIFQTDEGNIELFVLEETTVAGATYLLVTDTEEEDGDAFILKETTTDESGETTYDVVDDDEEMKAVGQVFQNLLDDIDLA